MKRRPFHPSAGLSRVAVALLGLFVFISAVPACAADYHRVVAITDAHVANDFFEVQEKTIGQINTWGDVDLVAVLGDLCATMGTDEEYAKAKALFSKLEKPFCPIVGNHDYIYGDWKNADDQLRKLEKFRKTFRLDRIYYTRELGNYLLIFLSTDRTVTQNYTEMSDGQLFWFEGILKKYSDRPTIVFFHGPLKGTTLDDPDPQHYAMPDERIRSILRSNPQVFLWVSGHRHLWPGSPSFMNEVNKYDGRVMNVHTTNMSRQTNWSNSLYLHPDHVLVRTFDHQKGVWLESLDRKIPLPRL